MASNVLNLFYEEPDADRWVRFDRFPRRAIRRIVRGRPRIGGQRRVFLNLCAGLDRLRVPYRVNDYSHARRHPAELACIIGKPHVLDKMKWENLILFGAAVPSHPVDDPDLFDRRPVKQVLVPGPWAEAMFKPHWDAVEAWPVGIDTDRWQPVGDRGKTSDVLLYDKVRWEHEEYEQSLLEPIRAQLRQRGHSVVEIRYGGYREEEYAAALCTCRTMIFLCEHETQGIAYQQALASGVPILAWDRGGPWGDPSYYPHRVIYEPVTSVPYWDDRCGAKFRSSEDFAAAWDEFWDAYRAGAYAPRDYILDELTLEKSAGRYVELADATGHYDR
jgi:glycosyltransferase involved in cell wall biosynthesis